MRLSRRDLLAGSAALALGSRLHAVPIRPFRVVHMTDFHVQPELQAAKGMEAALVHAMAKGPDLVLMGGDLIMDGLAVDQGRAKVQWRIYQELVRRHVHVPVRSAVGNHDPWGWNKAKSGATGSEALYGKHWWHEVTGEAKTTYSFDRAGWHFVVIDTILPTDHVWTGGVSPETLDWLAADLAQVPRATPVLILGHVPVISVTPMMTSWSPDKKEWEYGTSSQVGENRAMKDLFLKHANVKVVLSGHTHMVDRVDYNGVSYLCGGAVCGAWWMGRHQDFDPGYQVIDLMPDGSFKREYIAWGWKPDL